MERYTKVHSTIRPQEIEITPTEVYIAQNITPYEEILDNGIISGFEYDSIKYTKDEYLIKLAEENSNLRQELTDTQIALCDIYEALEGGDFDG